MYGAKGDRQIKLFEGDDHALTQNSLETEQLIGGFILRCAGVMVGDEAAEVLAEKLIDKEDKVELMKQGGDLRGSENVA